MAAGSGHDIIVIGASAGGIEAVSSLAATLPTDLPAAVFVVVHTLALSPGYIARMLDRSGKLPARMAADGEPISPGTILVAPPDHHLLLSSDRVQISRGPRENRSRPAIDPLFRSAAATFTTRVIGVILSGMLDDGAAGLRAVKLCGGKAMVQDPDEAPFPDMPRNALSAVDVDFRLPVHLMGAVLEQLARERAAPPPTVPGDLLWEVKMAGKQTKETTALGENSEFSCPECGGVLKTMPDQRVPRYRCHTGHAYTLAYLLQEQGEKAEDALWAALRRLEEHGKLLTGMAERAGPLTAESYRKKGEETWAHVEQLRTLLKHL